MSVPTHSIQKPPKAGKKKLGIKAYENDDYMEAQPILLPVLKDGVVALGDLWDCRTLSPAGNIFEKTLLRDHLEAHPIETMSYTMHRIRDYNDYANSLNVSASLSLEMPLGGGNLKVSGSGHYESTEDSKVEVEAISVKYEVNTYRVRLMPKSVDHVSLAMKNMLIGEDAKISATHYVESVILGANATGEVSFSENSGSSTMAMGGEFQLSLEISGIKIDASAKVDITNRESNENINTNINLQCQPRFSKAPTNSLEMFAEIETLDQKLNEQKHFPQFDEDNDNRQIVGVPVAFRLVPIQMMFPDDVKLDPTYQMLNAGNLEEFTAFVLTLQNFCDLAYIRKLMVDENPKIIPVLQDEYNPITSKIIEYSKARKDLAREIKTEVNRMFYNYKTKKEEEEGYVSQEDLLFFIKQNEDRFDLEDIMYDMREFVKECRDELNAICASDTPRYVNEWVEEPNIRFFSNTQDMEEWFFPSRTIKILLQTNKSATNKPTTSIFVKLYDLSKALKARGMEVGVALPCISEEYSLTFKSRYEETPHKYYGMDIHAMLNIMAVAVDEGETIAKIFYSVNATLMGLTLPLLSEFQDIPHMVTIMNDFRHTLICETYCELRARLLETIDTWNFLLPVQALHTSVEMVRFFRRLRKEIPEKYPNLRHRFIVGRFNEVDDKLNSPVLIVLHDDVLKAICLDHLDILLMLEEITKEKPNFDLITINRIRESCFYTPRVEFAISIGQHFSLDHRHSVTDPIFPYDEFPNNTDPNLPAALKMTAAACLRDQRYIMTTTARLALEEFNISGKSSSSSRQLAIMDDEEEDPPPGKDPPSDPGELLKYYLTIYGWAENEFSKESWDKIAWDEFYRDLESVVTAMNPSFAKIILALREIENLAIEASTKSTHLASEIDEIIDFLHPHASKFAPTTYKWMGKEFNEGEIFEDLRGLVQSYDGLSPNIKLIGLTNALKTWTLQNRNDPDHPSLFQLIVFAEGMKRTRKEGEATVEVKDLKDLLVPAITNYCGRLQEIDDFEYPRAARKLKDGLKEKQLFKVLGVLSEIFYHPVLYIVHQELYNLHVLPAPSNVKALLEKLTPERLENDDAKLEIIWTNPKFLHILLQSLSNPGVIDTLYIHSLAWSNAIYPLEPETAEDVDDLALGDDRDIIFLPFFPPEVVEKVKELQAMRRLPVFEWARIWGYPAIMVEQLQIFVARLYVPQDFLGVLREMVEKNSAIKQSLQSHDCLLYWDEEHCSFYSPWSIDTVTKVAEAMSHLTTYIPKDIPKKLTFKIKGDALNSNREITAKATEIELNSQWSKFAPDGKLECTTWSNFIRLDTLHPTTFLQYDRLQSFCQAMIANVLQQVRNLNPALLRPLITSKFINYPPSGKQSGHIDNSFPIKNLGFLMSSADIQTCILHIVDIITAHQYFNTLSKLPVALPLAITSILKHESASASSPQKQGQRQKRQEENFSYKLLHLALQNVIVQEFEFAFPLPQPRLFVEPFKLVVTMRVGDTKEAYKKGRSSFLNQHLFRNKNMFGSYLEPGAEAGIPINRDGYLEFTWLSETTCADTFWSDYIKPEYEKDMEKAMILLGNLHGDCFKHVGLLEELRAYISCFVVFWRVDSFQEYVEKKSALQRALGPTSKILDMVIYPTADMMKDIDDSSLIFHDNVEATSKKNELKIRRVITTGTQYTTKGVSTPPNVGNSKEEAAQNDRGILSSLMGTGKGYKLVPTSPRSIDFLLPIATDTSIALINFLESMTIVNFNKALAAQDEDVMGTFFTQFQPFLIRNDKLQASAHFIYELDHLSRKSRADAQQRVLKLRKEVADGLRLNIAAEGDNSSWILSVQDECKWSLENLRWNSLSMQDCIRTFWKLLDESGEPNYFVIRGYKDLLDAGVPIEMFNYTHSAKPFESYAMEVLKLIPEDTRVFVVSAVGMKDSGKSYLLNRLFGNGFTEFSTTFGVHLKICYLSEPLRAKTDCDAILVIDSEGVGSAENTIDPHTDALERKITTYLLGISNLSIVPVRESGLQELPTIFESCFTEACKLNAGEIIPDIFIAQQQSEFTENSVGALSDEFMSSLQNTNRSLAAAELKIGIHTRPGHNLYKVSSRQKHEELVHTLIPLIQPKSDQTGAETNKYHNSIQKLYEKIIGVVHSTKKDRLTIKGWLEKGESLWEKLSSLPSASAFKHSSAAILDESLAFDQRVDEVKASIDAAYAFHAKKAEVNFINGVKIEDEQEPRLDELFEDYKAPFDLTLSLRLTKVLKELQKSINTCDELEGQSEASKKRALRRRKFKVNVSSEVNLNACQFCAEAFAKREAVFAEVAKKVGGFLIEEDINRYTIKVRDSTYERLRQGLISRQILERKSDGEEKGDLFFEYKQIAENTSLSKPEQYLKFYQFVSTLQFVVPSRQQLNSELKEAYKSLPEIWSRHENEGDHVLPDLEPMVAFDVQIYNKGIESSVTSPKPEKMTWLQHDWLLARLEDIPKKMVEDYEVQIYRPGLARELQLRVEETVKKFEEYCGERVLPNFQWEIHFHAVQKFSQYFEDLNKKWDEKNNPLVALENMKDEFYAEDDFFLPSVPNSKF